MVPKSMPGAVKELVLVYPTPKAPVTAAEEVGIAVLVEAGSANRTAGGMVKVPETVGATQRNSRPALAPVTVEKPRIRTLPEGSPPVQVKVCPWLRVTVEVVDSFVQTSAAGSMMAALNAPTPGPPVPLTV